MGRSRLNPRLAKIHRSYAIDEIARLYSVHRNTVRAWIKAGLPKIDNGRPVLVLGSALTAFLQARRTAQRRPCGPAAIYCVRCREPRRPAGGVVEYRVMTPTSGNLVGRCNVCHAGLFRRVANARLEQVLGDLRLVVTERQEHIADSTKPTVNSDFKQVPADHAKTPR